MSKQEKKFNLTCPVCNSGQTYIRIKLNQLVCRKCGASSDLKEAYNNLEKMGEEWKNADTE